MVYLFQHVFTDATYIKERRDEFSKYHLTMLNNAAKNKGRLLDVGCGSGIFLEVAKASGWEAYGIDFSLEATSKVNKKSDLVIRSGTVNTALEPKETFDAITLFDYLEHSRTPNTDLQKLLQHLNPGGLMLIRVPNQKGLQARIMQSKWLAIIANHLSYFSAPVITSFLETNSMAVEKVVAQNYQTEFDMLRRHWYWVKQRLQRNKINLKSSAQVAEKTSSEILPQQRSRALRFLFGLLLEQIDHFGGWLNMGNNLMIVARKRR